MKRSSWAQQLGHSQETWDAARAEAREAILAAAGQRAFLTYSELAAAITAIPVTPHSPVLWHLLGEILEAEWDDTGLALTALVIHKGDPYMPGGGFFTMMRERAEFTDKYEFWISQVTALFERYGKKAS
jgi:hypothetical protein